MKQGFSGGETVERHSWYWQSRHACHAEQQERKKFHTGLFNAGGIGGDTSTKPGSGTRGTIKAGPALAFAPRFNNISPLEATDLFTLLRGEGGTKSGITKNASSSMGIELGIKSGIPFIPIVELLKVAAGKTAKLALSFSHTGGTKSREKELNRVRGDGTSTKVSRTLGMTKGS